MVCVGRIRLLLLLSFLLACASKKIESTPPPPTPPKDPWAWLPEDSNLVGQAALAPFRETALWSVWENAQKTQPVVGALIDPTKIERVVFAGADRGQEPFSFVVALMGPFGEGAVEKAAAVRNISREPQGLLSVYRMSGTAVAQVYPDLILAASYDRVAWLAARSSLGPAIKVHETALYRSLAARVNLTAVDLAVLGEDPRGEFKAMVERQAKHVGFRFNAADVVRAGMAVDLGQPTQLNAVVETTGAPQAEALKASTAEALSALSGNIFVGLLGLRPLVSALQANQDGSYVVIGGSVKQEDFNRALGRLANVLNVSLSRGDNQPQATP